MNKIMDILCLQGGSGNGNGNNSADNSFNNNALCNNCGRKGHLFQQCKLPITSYGVIAIRIDSFLNEYEYLMIRRKDSFGYIDFIRGKYSPYNLEHLQNIIDEMSIEEKERILTMSFSQLWLLMWRIEYSNSQYKNEETLSCKKFDLIRNGVTVQDKTVTLQELVENSQTRWTETEWEFPKGRRDYKERDLDCALREFEEETGLSKNDMTIIENILPFEEVYTGSNNKYYKHKYFLGFRFMKNNSEKEENLENFQKTEVSKLEWKTYKECLEAIRPYHLEKKKVIERVNNMLKEYMIYS
jgi:8-oxo-dGTP pyrophosphatase MutT (NUDIX family)